MITNGAEHMHTARVAKAKKIADYLITLPACTPHIVDALSCTSRRDVAEVLAGVSKKASNETWDLVIDFVTYWYAGVLRPSEDAGKYLESATIYDHLGIVPPTKRKP